MCVKLRTVLSVLLLTPMLLTVGAAACSCDNQPPRLPETESVGDGCPSKPKPPPERAKSFEAVNRGTYKTRDAAMDALKRDREAKFENVKTRVREECSKDCHLHLDVYNKFNEIIRTWHYTYHVR